MTIHRVPLYWQIIAHEQYIGNIFVCLTALSATSARHTGIIQVVTGAAPPVGTVLMASKSDTGSKDSHSHCTP